MPKLKANIQLIVGLGNPGQQYHLTRHNAGFTFLDQLAKTLGVAFKPEKKFKADIAKAHYAGHDLLLLKPDTFMNLSGDAVQKVLQFYKLQPEQMLVVHDELDLPCGQARWKKDGGHGGHNGLRDIVSKIGSNHFYRLRIGIGHPGQAHRVSNFVTSRPTKIEEAAMQDSINRAEYSLRDLLDGNLERAMCDLHSSD